MRPLRRALFLLLTVVALSAAGLAPASAAGDDYPWRADRTGSTDSWGFTKRQCVSFVAWRLAQRRAPVSNAGQAWGHARSWDDAARRLGHAVSTRPVVGAVAHWDAGESGALYTDASRHARGRMIAGAYGHVAFVRHVHTDGSVSVAHYNARGSRAYSVSRVRAPRYLLIGVR